jgi:fatty-acyl-CoA synthase
VDGVDHYEDLLGAARVMRANDEATLDDVTHILYTSGTTGRPKGVLCTQGTLAWHAVNLARDCRMAEAGNHHLNIVPLFHAGGLNVYTNPILYWGGHVTTTVRFDPIQTLELLTDPNRGITHFCAVQQMYEPVMALNDFAEATFPNMRCLLLGAWGPSVPSMFPRWRDRGFVVHTSYGGTEVGPIVTFEDGEDPSRIERGSSGRPFEHVEIRLCDENGSDVAAGEVGEMSIRGPSVTPGYWHLDRDKNFFGEWFRTGDAARRTDDGRYYIVERIKEMYRSGGENVFPSEVEAELVRAPGVRELAVVGVPDDRWGEVGFAFVVVDSTADVDLESIRAFGSSRLARFKLPQHLEIIDELPRNVTGKVARDELRRRAAALM